MSLTFCTARFTSLSGNDLITSSDGELVDHTGMVSAFDRSGATSCSCDPITCQARWATQVGDPFLPPAVSGGSIYQAAQTWCSLPEECGRVTTLTALNQATGAKRWTNELSSGLAGLAVADGWVHEAHADGVVSYHDAGLCATTCPAHHHSSFPGSGRAAVAMANGLVVLGNSSGVAIFDGTGIQGCTTAPVECIPIAQVGGFWTYEVSIALGNVWVVDSTGRLHALGLN